jgi:hypothetical protein
LLGGFIGSSSEKSAWLKKKTDSWVQSVEKISKVASKDPQSAFIAVSKSLQNEWTFTQRVMNIENDRNAFYSLKEAITQILLPEICGFNISALDSEIMLRPSRFGGIGIRDPVKTATSAFQTSFEATSILKDAIISGLSIDLNEYHQQSKSIAASHKLNEDTKSADEIKELLEKIPEEKACLKTQLNRIVYNKCSAWLSVNPWEDEFFSMTADEFKDSMACRYGKSPRALPSWCDGCGEAFDVNHALDCKNGGLVYQRHNEMRDENCDLNKKAGFSQVICEPIIKSAGTNGMGELRGDWSVRGFWVPQRMAVFDTRIFNANASSYKSISLEAAFNLHRNQKKQLYSAHVENLRGSFTPVIATCEGILDREADAYVRRLALHISKRWDKGFSQTMFWVRARIQICILRSVSNCFRGSRTKWRGGNIEDGAAMPRIDD